MSRQRPPLLPPRSRLRREEVDAWLAHTRAADAETRRRAVRALCPCHVRADDPRIWERVLEMVGDADEGVRGSVFHALTDGSPRSREAEVVAAIEGLHDDPDARLRRRSRQFLAQYRRSGRVNVN